MGFAGELAGGAGSYIPFPVQRVQERYQSLESYLSRYEKAARQLARERYLLEQDVPALMEGAAARWKWTMSLDTADHP
jgi:hypothetical protein